jgi:DNA-binding HTH domain-containing proteins
MNINIRHLSTILKICVLLGLLFHDEYIYSENDAERFACIANLIDSTAYFRGKDATALVDTLHFIASNHPEDNKLQVQFLYWKVRVNYLQDIHDVELLQECLELFSRLQLEEQSFEKTLLINCLSLCYVLNGNYTEAFSLALQTQAYFEQTGNIDYLVKSLRLLGSICNRTGSRNMAMNYYNQAIKNSSEQHHDYYSNIINYYTIQAYLQIDKGEQPSAIDSLLNFIPIIKRNHSTSPMLVPVYYNLGAISYDCGQTEKAKLYYDTCRQYMELSLFDNQSYNFGFLFNTALMYANDHNYTEAIKHLSSARDVNNKSLMQELYILEMASDIYIEMNQIDSAYHYLVQYKKLQNKLNQNSKTIESYQAYVSLFMESAQKELTISKQQAQLRKRQFIITLISALGILITIIFILIMVHQEKKKQMLLKDAEKRELFHKLKQEKEIKNRQKEKIESKTREIASYSLQLSANNQTLLSISKIINQLPNNQTEVKEINNIIDHNLNHEKAWSNFMFHFDKVHPCFFEKLKARHSRLTEANLRICAYFRIGLSQKEIALLLNISPENVKKSRYRLKKKLGLGKEDNLYDFLRNL